VVDLMVDTEFIKIGKNKYMDKLSNGIIYSEEELKELLRKNYAELNKQVVKEEKDEIKPETTKTNRRRKSTKRARD
jgi:hypothetical protein